MEAVPRLPMICFDLKVSPDRFPPEFVKLKQYIRDYYNEDPETYSTEIRNLETLRANAVHPSKDANGCEVLKKYFCQLHFLQSRFPIGRDESVSISFAWKDAYGGDVCTNADIKFEMVNILHNIGALHSQLGAGDDRTSPEGLKMACTHFQCAAWAFQHLKDSFPQPTGLDISPDMMQFMYQLCLAQAQECILEKSMTDNRKATINAKVAAQIIDYYNLALNALLQGPADDGSIMAIVGSKLFKSWKKFLKFKVSYYSCISLLYQGMQSEEQQKMGERIAYYQGALDKLNDAIKLSKGLDYGDVVMEALIFTRDVVEGKRKAAKNENDFIYHEDIPDLDTLPIIKGASLVKGIPFSVNDTEISGPDIFARLVPMKAHEVSSLYSEEKAKLLRKISAMIDSKDEEVVSFMSSLQLEYLRAHMDYPYLPQEVIDRCAALSAKPDAIPNLVAAMDKLSDAYHDVDGMLKEVMELIKIEEVSEREYQEVMGNRPPSIVATDLTREANKYMEAHKKAAESNETLHKAMTQHIENLRVLQRPLDEITANLPSLESLNLENDPSVKEVIMLSDKVNEMRKQRAMLASQLRESIFSDDITTQLVTRTEERKEDIFEKEMQKHNKYVTLIEQNLAAQDNIIPALADAYAKYAATRKAVSEIMRQREMMLSALISSYDAYEDLITKSNKGLEFYRKLETNLTKLLQRVKGTCKVQQEERDTILAQHNKKIEPAVDAVPPSNSTPSEGSGLKLKDFLQNRKAQQPAAQSSFYSAQVAGVDGQQTWLPSVRPAPLGSEGTSTTKQLDYAPYCMGTSYGAYTQAYGPEYAKNYLNYSYQNPLTVELQNLQYPNLSVSGTNTAVNPMSTPSPKQYNTSNPYGYSQGVAYNSSDPSNAIPVQYSAQPPAQYTTAQTASVQYNSGQPASAVSGLGSSNPSSVQQTYSATQYQYPAVADPTQNYQNPPTTQTFAGSQPYRNTDGQTYSTPGTPQNYPAAVTQSYQTSLSSQTSDKLTYQTPATQNYNQVLPTENYQTPTTQSYQNPPAGNYQMSPSQYYQSPAQNYQLPTTQSYQDSSNLNYQVQSNQGYQSVGQNSVSQQQNPGATATQAQQYSSETTQQAYSSPVAGTTDQQNTLQTNLPYSGYSQNYQYATTAQWPHQGYSYGASGTTYNSLSGSQSYPGDTTVQANISYGSEQNMTSISNSVNEGNVVYTPGTIPTSVVNQTTYPNERDYYKNIPANDFSQYYPHYSNTYPKVQFQDTLGTGTSHYSNAGGKNTSETNSSSVTPEGLTYATQYVASTVPAEYQNYYTTPYGYQYTMPGAGNTQPKTVVVQPPLMQPNSMTYIQASNSGMMVTTFSQQQNGTQPTTPAAETAKQPSNLDLLTGLDFTVTNTPPLKPVSTLNTSQNQLVEQSQEKMADLSLEPKPAPSSQSTSCEIDSKNKQNTENGNSNSVNNIERPSPSKTPLKDPFSDSEVLSQFVQEVEKFEKFVEGLNIKTLNGPTPLDIKWNELQDLQEKDAHKQIISVARCYPMKNRFPDFLPFDSSRVELPSTKDDYINASHVKDLRPYAPNFIVTQAPLPSTYADFWTMVIEQHVEIIVCLLAESQMNGEIYWPVNKTDDLVHGKLKISLQSLNSKQHWIERIMSVSDGKISRVVMHLQFTSWPHSWMPESPSPILSLVMETIGVWSEQRGRGPIVVHCDSGVGRSGLFVLLTIAASDLRVAPHLPDPISLAVMVAAYRKNPLRDRAHLTFAYHSILYYCRDLLMKRGILASRSTFEEKKPKTKSHTRHPSEDFLLNSLNKEHNEERRQSDASSTESASRPCLEGDPISQLDPLWPIKRYS